MLNQLKGRTFTTTRYQPQICIIVRRMRLRAEGWKSWLRIKTNKYSQIWHCVLLSVIHNFTEVVSFYIRIYDTIKYAREEHDVQFTQLRLHIAILQRWHMHSYFQSWHSVSIDKYTRRWCTHSVVTHVLSNREQTFFKFHSTAC